MGGLIACPYCGSDAAGHSVEFCQRLEIKGKTPVRSIPGLRIDYCRLCGDYRVACPQNPRHRIRGIPSDQFGCGFCGFKEGYCAWTVGDFACLDCRA